MYKLTLNSLFDYTNNDGVFTYLASQNVPWKNDVDADLLDLDYHSKHGTKIVSKTVTSLLDEDGLSSANKTKLARLLYKKNKQRWDELWGSMGLYDDFNPLDNTNWTEEERLEHRGSDSRTHNLGAKQTTFTEGQQIDTFNKGAQSNSMTKGQEQDTFVKGAETRTTNKGQQVNTNAYGQQENVEGQQVNTTGNQSNTHEEQTSAFNSSTYQPDKKVIDTLGQRQDTLGQKTNTLGAKSDTLTEGQRQDSETLATFTDTTTYGNRSDSATEGAREDSTTKGQRQDTTSEGAQVNSESGSDSYTDIHTITRAGNIGVTTSGQLIDDFRRVVNWKFFEIIYKDIDEMLCLEVYGCEEDDFSDYKIVSPYKLPIASAQTLGGIKVGQNLSIASDGTLNAQGGGVTSVNGKTGIVTLDASDVGAASASDIVNIRLDINQLQGSVLDLRDRTSANETDIVNIKLDINQLQGSVLGLHNDLQAVRQVPTGGTEGQVLTKGASGYDWADAQGGSQKTNIPYTLSTKLVGYASAPNKLQLSNSSNNARSYLFDVQNYIGKDFEFFMYKKSTFNLNQLNGGFISDLEVTGPINDSIPFCYTAGTVSTFGMEKSFKVPYVYRGTLPFNYIVGTIPSGVKYFIFTLWNSDISSTDRYNDLWGAEFNVLN